MSTTRIKRARAPSGARARVRFFASCAAAAFGSLALLASPASAGPPVHPPLGDPITGFALDHACGAATDSNGDIYVSNAGNNAVEVFDRTGTHLATIGNSNTPCGLAVDTNGRVYVSEQGTGNVLRYDPDAYPLTGSPVYSGPTTIDSSGVAKGISVDAADDRLYVARGAHIAVYNPDGSFTAANEVQTISIGATSGTYTLTFQGQTTAPLAFDATSPQVQAALEALSTIGAGNVSVTPSGANHQVTFVGALANTQVPQMTGDGSGLSGGFGLAISTTTEGFSGQIGDGQLANATGVAAYRYPKADRFPPNDRYVAVADDAAADSIKFFGGNALTNLALRTTVDGSQTPDGDFGFGSAGAQLAADSGNGHFFVYDDAHTNVDEFEATGQHVSETDSPDFTEAQPTGLAVFPENDELQQVVIDAQSGTFTLSFGGDETTPLDYNATAAQVEAALTALPSIGSGGVRVYRGSSTFVLNPYRIRFNGSLGRQNVDQLTANASGLSGNAGSVPGTGPAATVTTLTDGQGPGRLYVSAGAGSGAKLLAFGALAPPSRVPLPNLEVEIANACGVAVDSAGNRYIAGGSSIRVFDPSATLLTTITGATAPCDLEVDSAGNVFAQDRGPDLGFGSDDRIRRFTPQSFPPASGTSYTMTTVPLGAFQSSDGVEGIGLNPANGHLFATNGQGHDVAEFDSPANGFTLLDATFADGVHFVLNPYDVDVDGMTGNVYVGGSGFISVVNPAGTARLALIDGSGTANGAPLGGNVSVRVAVNQSNGHVLFALEDRRVVEEYEPSGTLVTEIGSFNGSFAGFNVAVDNSGGPTDGNVYTTFLGVSKAFGPLSYGEPPIVVTGLASAIGGGNATLNGTVDPRGFPVTDCHFDYRNELELSPPAWPHSVPCAETLAQIGSGSGPVPVHADLTGLDPEGRYHFRLVAANEFGTVEGDPGLFGPPILTTKPAQPILYTEATARARIDPSGLPTTYRVEYGDQGPCDSNPCSQTAEQNLAAGAGPTDVEVPLFGLAEGTPYHFRFLVANEAKALPGPDQSFTTLARLAPQDCPNAALRTGRSAALPDCRAYELVTPADTGGQSPYATDAGSGAQAPNSWHTPPYGPAAGSRLTFDVDGTLPGFDGTGRLDEYRAGRDEDGWTTVLTTPSYQGAGGGEPRPQGIGPDQLYSFMQITPQETFPGTLADGRYLRTPAGFELIAQGSLGTDSTALGHLVTSGASHVIFSTDIPGVPDPIVQLEPNAPPDGTNAVYDRSDDGPTEVVSLLPDGSTPATDATYAGASEDGSAIGFEVGGSLYVRRGGATVKVADPPNDFAGISDDGQTVFYAATNSSQDTAASLFAFDLGSQATTEIAPDSRFVNVSAGGTHVYFTSELQLGGEPGPAVAQPNLYVWDGSEIRFVAVLDPGDVSDPGDDSPSLTRWAAVIAGGDGIGGRANNLSRSNPDGEVLIFESQADLTPFASGGHTQIYRYDARDDSLLCVSCDPSGAPPTSDAFFQSDELDARTAAITLIPNLTDNGNAVFFEVDDPLLPEDANSFQDVYEWTAEGSGGCADPGGCLALISGGQNNRNAYLFSMTPDGHDVFFTTTERLIESDLAGSPSIYDARVDGGFPEEAPAPPCVEDACQGPPSPPPTDPAPGSGAAGTGNQPKQLNPPATNKKCKKGRKLKKGKCVKRKGGRK